MISAPAKREEPRIPFGTLVERGLLKPGDVLVDVSQRFSAKVRADGTVISAASRGSIHRVGAEVQGAPACNGWAFWHFMHKGQPVSIDVLRQQVRAEMGRNSHAGAN
jgi:modification methylase